MRLAAQQSFRRDGAVWGGIVVALAVATGSAVALIPSLWLAIPVGIVVILVILKWGPHLSRPAGIENPLLAHVQRTHLAIELVALPLVVSIRQDNKYTIILLLGVLGIGVMRTVGRDASQPRCIDNINLTPTVLLMGCVFIVFWRGNFIVAAIYVLAFLILVNAARVVSRPTAYASLLAGLSLYIVSNTVGWLIGLQSASSAVRLGGYETSGGFFNTRVFFPFTISINEPAFISAALIAAVAAMISLRQRPPWYLWVGALAGVFVIIASNSRVPLIIAAPVIALLLFAPRVTRAVAPYVVGASMLLPVLMAQLQPILSWIAELVASNRYLARTQDFKQILGLSSRGDIWSRSLDYWSVHVTDSVHQVIGYGYFGHASSGALASYDSGISGYFTERAALSMHNSMLQTLFDGGLLGASILFGVTIYTIYRYGRHTSLLPMLAVAIVLGLSATTEAILAPGFGNTPTFLLLYLVVFIPAGRQSARHGATAEYTAARLESHSGQTVGSERPDLPVA